MPPDPEPWRWAAPPEPPPGGWPAISLVTPVRNGGPLLAQAMDSVLGQRYPALEYVAVDGGSTDGSVEAIRAREAGLAHWTSAPDAGPYDAIARGFARTTGGVMGWLNADDLHAPWTLWTVGQIFAQLPEVEWLTTAHPLIWGPDGLPTECGGSGGYTAGGFYAGRHAPRAGRRGAWVQQESTFWRRSLWDRAGGRLDPALRLAADFELWARFFEHAPLYAANVPLAGFRLHGGAQRSVADEAAYAAEAEGVLARYGGRRGGPGAFVPPSGLMPGLGRRALRRLGLVEAAPLVYCAHARGPWRVMWV